MLKPLNPLLHSELRLAIVSILLGVESADFVYLRKQTGATAGNLSVQLEKLNKAGYIDVEKGFNGRCRVLHAALRSLAARPLPSMSRHSESTYRLYKQSYYNATWG